MAKKLAIVSHKTFEKLERFDYGDLYSIHNGLITDYWEEDDAIEIFCGVNRNARLYIIVNFAYGEHYRTFDFDQLDKAGDWVKRRVRVVG